MFKQLQEIARKRLHVSSKEFRVILLVCVLSMIGALTLVWPNVKMVKMGYENQVLAREHRLLLQKNNHLKLERASLQSLDRIQFLAKNRIGLQRPGKGQIVTVFLQ